MNQYQYVLWDWNGTLFNDMDAGIQVINRLMDEEGIDHHIDSLSQYHHYFTFPVIHYYQRLGFDFTKTSFDLIAQKYVRYYHQYMKDCHLHTGVKEVLDYLKRQDVKQVIISASSQTSLDKQVSLFPIKDYFEDIKGIDNDYGSSKIDMAKNYLLDHHIAPETVLFVGDTDHDREVAKQLHCDCILINNGHQNIENEDVVVLSQIEDIYPYL